jgi:hypothetical protein
MPYYLQTQDLILASSQSQIFEAPILTYTAPKTLPPKRFTQTTTTSNILLEPCTDADMNSKLQKAVLQALLQAKKSMEYVQSGKGDRTIMQNFFKADDAATCKLVIDCLTAIVKVLSSTIVGPGKLVCSSTSGPNAVGHRMCVLSGAVAMTDRPNGKVSLCPAVKRYPVEFKACGDSN